MRPPENSSDLTPAQLDALERRATEHLRFLRGFLTGIDQCRFPAGDPIRRDVFAAYSAAMRLRMTLHYMRCDRLRNDSPTDSYAQYRRKRKG